MLEPVHVAELTCGRFRVLFSPGLVYGVAAGDEISLQEDGQFTILSRSRNLAVRLYSEQAVAPLVGALVSRVEQLGGTLDGQVKRGLAFTIPVAAGFAAIEKLFSEFVAAHQGTSWEYGNVYGEHGESLGWWEA